MAGIGLPELEGLAFDCLGHNAGRAIRANCVKCILVGMCCPLIGSWPLLILKRRKYFITDPGIFFV